MLNYARMSINDGEAINPKTDLLDVVNDIRDDLSGWAVNLVAIGDQDSVIERNQINLCSTQLFIIVQALDAVIPVINSLIKED